MLENADRVRNRYELVSMEMVVDANAVAGDVVVDHVDDDSGT